MAADQDVYAQAKKLHDDLRSMFGNNPKTEKLTAITIMSMHDGKDGQWILGAPEQDHALVALRLRLCADILDAAHN
jgi:hypothetical protein